MVGVEAMTLMVLDEDDEDELKYQTYKLLMIPPLPQHAVVIGER